MTSSSPVPPPSADLVTGLEAVFARLVDRHRRLRDALAQKREAIRVASIDDILALCERERDLLAEIVELDRGRLRIVGTIMFGPAGVKAGGEAIRLADLLPRIPEPARARIDLLATELRRQIKAAQTDSSIVRKAGEHLARHIAGIQQMVHRAVSSCGTYERRGRIAVGAPLESHIDVKS